MSNSLGTMSAKITADASGLSAATAKARADIASLSQTGGMGGGAFGQLLDLGKQFAGPLAAVASIGGLVSQLRELQQAAWQIRDDAGDIGISVEMFQQLEESARRAGEGMDMVVQSTIKMQKFIAEAEAGTASAKATLDELGLSADDLIGMDTQQQLQAFAKAITAIENPAMRTRLEMEVFSKSGKKMEDILFDIADGLGKYNKAVISAGSISAMADAQESANRAWVSFKATLGEIWGTILRVNFGFGEQQKSQSQLAADAEREAKARREAADAARRQREEQERIKQIEAGRKERTGFLDDLRAQFDTIVRGTDEIDRKAGQMRQSARDEYATRLKAAEEERAKKPVVKPPELGGPADQAAAIRAEQQRQAAVYQAEVEAAGHAYQENLRLIDEHVGRLREAKAVQESANTLARERAEAENQAKAAMDAQATAAEKAAEAQRQAARWRAAGWITPQQYDALLAKSRRDLAAALKTEKGDAAGRSPEYLERGSQAEADERARLVNEARAGQQQDRALQIAEEQLRQQEAMRTTLEKMLNQTEPAEVWGAET